LGSKRPLRRGDARRNGIRSAADNAHRRPLSVRLRGDIQSRRRLLYGDRHRPPRAGKRMNQTLPMSASLRLIVTGMHRSGTSFVASLLAAWNVRMCNHSLPADGGNPAGYFEDVDFLELNRRILMACTPAEEGHRDWGW